jgi:hypothetical protein
MIREVDYPKFSQKELDKVIYILDRNLLKCDRELFFGDMSITKPYEEEDRYILTKGIRSCGTLTNEEIIKKFFNYDEDGIKTFTSITIEILHKHSKVETLFENKYYHQDSLLIPDSMMSNIINALTENKIIRIKENAQSGDIKTYEIWIENDIVKLVEINEADIHVIKELLYEDYDTVQNNIKMEHMIEILLELKELIPKNKPCKTIMQYIFNDKININL